MPRPNRNREQHADRRRSWTALLLVVPVAWTAFSASPARGGEAAADSEPVAIADSLTSWSAEELWARPDTTRLRFELGFRSDVTNESYYEDAFVDTTFLGRRLVNTPEQIHAAVLSTSLSGTRGLRASRYDLQTEVSLGELLQRGYAALRWRSPLAPSWNLHLNPTAEYRHQLSFDRDLEEWRGAVGARARYDFGDGLTGAEMGVRGNLLRASGRGSEFLLDHQAGTISAGVDHFGLAGGDWRAGYTLTTRSFPDSGSRDHLEHGWEGRYRWGAIGVSEVAIEGMGTRRATTSPAATSRDNYWNGEATLEARFGGAGRWPVIAGLGGELFRYDVQDSTIYFDYGIARAHASVRWEAGPRWTLALGPRAEGLRAGLNPGEGYDEVAAVLDAEFLGSRSRWSVDPVIGWRSYDRTPALGLGTAPLHSSYSFYQLDLMADQSLPGRLKLRLLAILRWEKHLDPAQDAGSVYLTGELRWTP